MKKMKIYVKKIGIGCFYRRQGDLIRLLLGIFGNGVEIEAILELPG